MPPATRGDFIFFISAQKAPVKTVEVPADLGTLQSEYDELKKDQDDLLELLSDQQLKIGIGFELISRSYLNGVRPWKPDPGCLKGLFKGSDSSSRF